MTVPLLLSTIHESIEKFSLDQITFTQITKFFNLIVDSSYDPNPYNTIQEKFKSKLFDIFQTQGPNYRDYLNLPKFGSLKLSTQQKLRILFNSIWSEYQRKLQAQKNMGLIKEFEKMIPQFKSLDQVQTFHMELLKSFKSSRLNRENSEHENSKMSFPPTPGILPQLRYKRPHEATYYMPETIPKFNSNPFPGIGSGIGMKNIFPKIEDDPKYSNPIWADDNKFVQNSSSFPIHNNKMPMPHHQHSLFPPIEPAKINHHQKVHSHQQVDKLNASSGQHHIEDYLEDDQQQKINHLILNDEEMQEKIHSLLFSECACEGSLESPSASYIVCKNCQFYFHHQCLLLSQDSTNELCPCCTLKEGSNIFMNIHNEVFGKRWCKNMKSQKLTMNLTQRQIDKLKSEKASCKQPSEIEYQLRFLKIIESDKKNQLKSNPPNEIPNRRFNNITLPKSFVQKLQPYNQFQIGLKPTDEDKESDSVCFFGIFFVQKFSQRQLTERLFSNIKQQNSVDESYMGQFLMLEQDYLEIKMRDPTSQRRIVYPARGNRCSHPDVFDYLSLLEYYKEYGQKLNKKHCPICETEIDHVKADRFLLGKIRAYDQEGQRDCELLRYYNDGRVEFVQEDDQMGDSENQNEIDQENEQGDDNSEDQSQSD